MIQVENIILNLPFTKAMLVQRHARLCQITNGSSEVLILEAALLKQRPEELQGYLYNVSPFDAD